MATKLRLLAVLAVALALGAVSLASATGTATDDRKKVRIIDLTAKTVQESDIDLGAEGFSLGDRFVFSDDVFRDDGPVGMLGGECTAVRILPQPLAPEQEPESVTVNCVVTLELPRGQVTVQGLITFSQETEGQPFTLAVTGGTGAYRTARGEAQVTETSDVDSSIRLTLIL
jgi:hypothetical protein